LSAAEKLRIVEEALDDLDILQLSPGVGDVAPKSPVPLAAADA
jgi:hypothetical protein